MKRLRAIDPPRQQIWEHEGKQFSIVDLCLPPREVDGRYSMASERWGELMSFYKPYNFEVAVLVKPHVEVLGRYKSPAQARAAIKSGAIWIGN